MVLFWQSLLDLGAVSNDRKSEGLGLGKGRLQFLDPDTTLIFVQELAKQTNAHESGGHIQLPQKCSACSCGP